MPDKVSITLDPTQLNGDVCKAAALVAELNWVLGGYHITHFRTDTTAQPPLPETTFYDVR